MMTGLYEDDPGFDPGACADKLMPADRALIVSCAHAWLARMSAREPPEAEEAFIAGAAWAMQFRWE
jgi:hypothetical protein